MASIRFDFLSTGAAALSRDFRSIGDDSALSSRGVKTLSDIIERLGAKEDRTAAESKILAGALRQTGEAADRTTARMVLADAAVRRLDDDMKAASRQPLVPQVLEGPALKKLAGIQAAAEDLRKRFPQFTVQINDRAAKAELALFAAEAKRDLDTIDKRLGGAGGRGGILRLIPGLGGGAAGAGTSGASGAAPLLSNPYVLGGGAAAAAAVAPFAAQLAGGGIVAAFGAALAGMAILGASKAKSVQDSFANLQKNASASLVKIGSSFVPVVNSILSAAGGLLTTLTPVFSRAAAVISGPFRTFATTLIGAFATPAVQQSIAAVAAAFGKILTAVSPALTSGIGKVAGGITEIANNISKMNPAVITHFVNALFDVVAALLDTLAWLVKVGNYVEQHFGPAMHRVAVIFDGVRGEVHRIWNAIYDDTIGVVIRLNHNVETQFNSWRHGIAVVFDGVRHDIAHVWDLIWNNTIGRIQRGIADVATGWRNLQAGAAAAFSTLRTAIATAWNTIWANTVTRVSNGIADVVRFFNGLPGKIAAAVGGGLKVLSGWGHDVIQGILNGINTIWQSVLNFFLSVPKAILHALGIKSPPQWAIDAGKHIMHGIGIGVDFAKGVVSKATAAAIQQAAVGALGGPTSASAGQAQAYARSRLGAYGWGIEQMKPLILLWNQESGWNRLARNPSSGAYGIPQALPASKMGAAANPPQSSAAAQINWGLSYIKGRYGSPAGAWAHEIANNWYAGGTPWARPGWAMVGERGPELVRFRGGEQVVPGSGLDGWVAELRALRGQMAELIRTTAAVPAATGRHVAGAVGGAGADAAFRRRYPGR